MSLISKIRRIKNRKFMEAAVAGCAMVAFADGMVHPDELAKMIHYTRIDETLSLFDPTLILDLFDRYIEEFEFDFRFGKMKALKNIGQIGENPEQARLIVLVCCAVAKADDKFDNDEKTVIREICMKLGMNPDEFDLKIRTTVFPIRKPFYRHSEKGKKPSELRKNSCDNGKRKKISKTEIPDWMKKTKTYKRQHEASNRFPERTPESAKIPEWMKHPPDFKTPGFSKNQSNQDENLPDWMKNSLPTDKSEPALPLSDTESGNNLPDWMKKK